jgi:hypothetical protein
VRPPLPCGLGSDKGSNVSAPAATPPDPAPQRRILIWGGVVCVSVLMLRVLSLLWPMLMIDDFQILAQSWTWKKTTDNLFVPANEHSMPLGRITTWLMIRSAGRLSNVPHVFCWQGPLAALVAVLLVCLFVRREAGQPFPALLAMTLFGVSTHYWEAVGWFAASFAVVALDVFLLGLLAAQRWRQTGRWFSLFLSALCCALAPGWFGSGVLAGPLCSLFLLASDPTSVRRGWRRLALVPTAGTVLSLAITLPQNAEKILNLPRVESGQKAWQTVNPVTGLVYTLRALVDNVIPGAIGFPEVTTPLPWVWLGLAVLAAAAAWWWWQAPRRNLVLLGVGMIVSSYLLVFTGRADKDYVGMHQSSRYQLYANLGLALIVCGGLPVRWYPSSLAAIPHWKAAVFFVALLATQLPRNWNFVSDGKQAADFRRVEEVDARCARFHIDADTARQALPPFLITGCGEEQKVNGRTVSGWDFLHGSDDPRPVSVEEARRLLDASPER